MATTISDERVERLNRRAMDLAGLEGPCLDITCPEFHDACRQVVEEEGLEFLHYAGGDPAKIGTTDGPQCEVYREPATGRLVNLWIEGDSLGFDDQVEG